MESSNFGNPKKSPKSIKQTIYDKIIDRYNYLFSEKINQGQIELTEFTVDENFNNQIKDFIDYSYPIDKNLDNKFIKKIKKYYYKNKLQIGLSYFLFLDFVVIIICLQIKNFDLEILNNILKSFEIKVSIEDERLLSKYKENIINYLITNREQIDNDYINQILNNMSTIKWKISEPFKYVLTCNTLPEEPRNDNWRKVRPIDFNTKFE